MIFLCEYRQSFFLRSLMKLGRVKAFFAVNYVKSTTTTTSRSLLALLYPYLVYNQLFLIYTWFIISNTLSLPGSLSALLYFYLDHYQHYFIFTWIITSTTLSLPGSLLALLPGLPSLLLDDGSDSLGILWWLTAGGVKACFCTLKFRGFKHLMTV